MPRAVLVVDSDSVEAKVLRDCLGTEYHVIAAADGAEMFSLLRQRAKLFSCIVLDLALADMDGYEALRELSENAVYRQIPVIVTVERDDEDSQVRAMSLGANGCVFKPINKALLVHTLENAVNLREKSALLNAFRRDELTGLFNRTAFFEVAESMLCGREAGHYIISCMDIASFKVINDQYGIAVGDQVLKHMAEKINNGIQSIGGICCRYTGDKFGVLFPAGHKNSDTIKKLHDDVVTGSHLGITVRMRIGRYLADDLSVPVSAMFDRAIMAEESIRGRYDVYIAEYTDSLRTQLLGEQKIVNKMDAALRNGEFVPWLQPQYNHSTGAIIGAEALVRWKSGDGLIPPSEFIPVFERNGFIYEMDKYVWEQVCILLRRWLDEGRTPPPVSVNVSRRDLFHKHFIDTVTGLVKKYDIPLNLLRLEVTESAFAEKSGQIVAKVDELIDLGFTVAIDDFGSGYSSLNTLKDVPASILKLDMKFFENTENRQRGGNIIESVVRMARWLGMAVLAEGVEDKEQADYLKSIGCSYIQGYYYARPMPVEDYEKLLDSSDTEPKLSGLTTLKTLDSSEFWNPRSMDTLIFNSYVGGACIFEYSDGKTELLRVNERYAKELGQLVPESAHLSEMSAVPYMDEENKNLLFRNIRTAIETEKESSCQVKLVGGTKAKPHVEYVQVTARAIASSAEHYLFYCVVVNVTRRVEAERKQMETARSLRNTMENMNALLEDMPGGYVRMHLSNSGKFIPVYSNQGLQRLFGMSREQLQKTYGDDVFGGVHPEDKEAVRSAGMRMLSEGKSQSVRFRTLNGSGDYVWMRLNGRCKTDENGETYFNIYYSDASQSEAEAKKSSAHLENYRQLELLTSSIAGGLAAYSVNSSGIKMLYFNDGYFEFSGCTRDEYARRVAEEPLTFVFEEDRPVIRGLLRDLDKKPDGHVNGCDYRCHTADGGYRWMSMKSVLTKQGEGRYIVNVIQLDVTEQQEEKERLRQSEEFSRLAMEQSGKIITRVDVLRKTLTLPDKLSPIYELPPVLYGVPEEQIALGRISLDTVPIYRKMFEDIFSGVKSGSATFKHSSTKGWRWLESSYTTIFSKGGKPAAAVISFEDVTKELEKELVYNKWQQSLMDRPTQSYTLIRCNLSRDAAIESQEGELLRLDFSGMKSFDECTAAYAEYVFGEDLERYLAFAGAGGKLADYYRGSRFASIEYREKNGADEPRWLRLTMDMVEYPNSRDIEAYLMFEDIDEQKKEELLTRERSETDPLTGILNRAAFIERMEQLLRESGPAEKHALFMLDIDNFKQVNDVLGHGEGDRVLMELTSQISSTLRRGDLMGRLGGDEFFVLLKDVPDRDAAASKAHRICAMNIGGEGAGAPVTASIGVAMIPENGRDFDTLYKKVDAALYRQKAQGKNGYLFAEG